MTESEKKAFVKQAKRFFEVENDLFENVPFTINIKMGTLSSTIIETKPLYDKRVERLDERKKYWSKTFAKWGLIALGVNNFRTDTFWSADAESCGLCNKYMNYVPESDRNRCHWLCPVKNETGKDFCVGTPYWDLSNENDSTVKGIEILAEISFLCRLCREDFSKCFKNT